LTFFLSCLTIDLESLEVLLVLIAEVVPLDGLLVEVEAPNLGDFALRLGQLLVVLAVMELLLDG